VAVTSLRLPSDLNRRLERLAAHARKTPHAFMLEVLAREAERSELRERFAAEAAQSEQETLSGNTYALTATFDYLEGRVAGTKVRRPKARACLRFDCRRGPPPSPRPGSKHAPRV
jgi:predicted transcriptional regulator